MNLATLCLLSLSWVFFAANTAASDFSLDSALTRAFEQNPELLASDARSSAQQARISAKAFLDDPMIGFEREANMNFMEQEMGAMSRWSIVQDLKFPTKYFAMGSVERARSKRLVSDHLSKRLEVRRKVIATYYRYFAVSRIVSLLDANLNTVRELARAAEARHATGAVPQQDEMKAHVEETRTNAEILMAKEEKRMAELELLALLNGADGDIPLPVNELSVPKLTKSPEQIRAETSQLNRAQSIRQQQASVDEMQAEKSLAVMSYIPDFRLTYKKAFGDSAPDKAYSFMIEASIPLWFGIKQRGEVSGASAAVLESERMLDQARLETRSQVRSLLTRVETRATLLKIYETALIPQATSTLNASQGAYRAGRVSILELLDSERALNDVRVSYYRTLVDYTEAVASLEERLGKSMSDLPARGFE